MASKANLVIVESPSKAKTIGKYLGPEYVVKASMGHLRDLPKSTMGVDIEGGFVPEYLPLEAKSELIAEAALDPGEALAALTLLEVKGLIRTLPGGWVERA